jgi:hypothetical protein
MTWPTIDEAASEMPFGDRADLARLRYLLRVTFQRRLPAEALDG